MSKRCLAVTMLTIIVICTVVIDGVMLYLDELYGCEYSLENITEDKISEETEGEIKEKIEEETEGEIKEKTEKETELDRVKKYSINNEVNPENISRSSELNRSLKNYGLEDNLQYTHNNVMNFSNDSVKYVDTVSKKLLYKEEYVYGVKISTYNNVTYDVYSNGYTDVVNNIINIEVDSSNYNGSTASLLNEARESYNQNVSIINEIVNITNCYRKDVDKSQLKLDYNLCIAASVRALEMSYTQKTSHIRPDGARYYLVLDDLGIKYMSSGENICNGFKEPSSACEAWKNSASHYENIISGKYNKIGIGVAKDVNGKMYWVQIFSN